MCIAFNTLIVQDRLRGSERDGLLMLGIETTGISNVTRKHVLPLADVKRLALARTQGCGPADALQKGQPEHHGTTR